ncbi:MAG: NUDIX domain-containing protein [Bacteroidota bacterium]|nr:NUDIX domain-containing protein [Bacteroidota bacterium]|tara:strand:- start:168 stop:857 length:690 start_codon:yes stop_codon:yes gene_type:complete
MNTIFVNDIPIRFKKLDNLKLKKENYDTYIDGSSGVVPKKLYSRVLIYDSTIETIVDLLKKMTKYKFKKIYSISITLKNKKKTIKKVKKMFTIIKAGGGVVSNSKKEILFIYRMKKWDLPKGKLEKGESIKDCAVREVQEETKVNVKCGEKILSTWHTYTKNKKFILKKTTWFNMNSVDDSKMKPQKKEKIEKVEWMKKPSIDHILLNSYKTLNYLMMNYFKSNNLNHG